MVGFTDPLKSRLWVATSTQGGSGGSSVLVHYEQTVRTQVPALREVRPGGRGAGAGAPLMTTVHRQSECPYGAAVDLQHITRVDAHTLFP